MAKGVINDIDSKIAGARALISELQSSQISQIQATDAQKQITFVDTHKQTLDALLTYSISKLENQNGDKPLRSLEDRISAIKFLLDKE